MLVAALRCHVLSTTKALKVDSALEHLNAVVTAIFALISARV